MKTVEIGSSYTFKQLEEFLDEFENKGIALVVKHDHGTAIMHVFMENFCGDWLSGEGVLFYNDGEAHTADADTEFEVLQIINF